MAKPKRGTHSGPHKNHGPKRNMWKDFKPLVKQIADAGLLTKYNCYESWCLACSARGKKDTTKSEFNKFVLLSRVEKDKYFKELRK